MAEESRNHVFGRGALSAPAPWDYYFLRYFVGAVVGAGLLVSLWTERSIGVLSAFGRGLPSAPHEWLELAAGITALGAGGLAYCYIASAPILLLHATRFRLRFKTWRPRLFRVGLLFVALAPVSIGVCSVLFKWTPHSVRNSPFVLVLYLPYAVVVAVQLRSLMADGLGAVRDFYDELAGKRADKGEDAKIEQYVESYRHLREHGNAFSILVMEVVLAAAIYAACNTILLFGLIVTWIIPAAFSWFIGTWLEFGLLGQTDPPASPREVEAVPFRFGVLLFGGKQRRPR